jgi:vancomycin resistance protein VanW
MFEGQIPKPIKRGRLRQFLGREYFVLRRRLEWRFGRERIASTNGEEPLPYSLIRHRSMLLRPLKDVDMYLQHNKITNLRLAIEQINGIMIKPGETLSVWRQVGRPTAARGFLEGLVLNNGQIGKGIGGGLCQLGNLLYWMALHTPLTVAERWRHGFDVFPDINRNIPFAAGATLSYNYVDLKLKNDTNEDYQIKLWLDDVHLNGEITSNIEPAFDYEVFETDHHINTQWWGGYTRHNKIWKRVTSKYDRASTEELISENHAIMMYSPLLKA